MDWLYWIGAAFALGIVEVLVLDVVVLMFIGGAAAAAIAAAFGAAVWVQFLVFGVTSSLLVWLARPWAMRWLKKNPRLPMGVEVHQGKHATAVTEVTANGGQIKLAGELWSARLADAAEGTIVPIGTDLLVLTIKGATAVVIPAPEEQWNGLLNAPDSNTASALLSE